jgi:hypothetical protein
MDQVSEAISDVQQAVNNMILEFRNPDPVSNRRSQVRCAKALREAANALDDHGRLTE